jgi:hypothetical protein
VIEVRMGQDSGLDASGLNGELYPVLQAQRLESLEQAAIDKEAMGCVFDQVFRTGNGAGATQEG